MNRKNFIALAFVLISIFVFAAMAGKPAFAYTLDGDLSDWGVTPFVDWVPDSSTADYNEEDDFTYWVSTGTHAENTDVEAMYFDDDGRYLYFAMVSSFPLERDGSGDLALDLNNDGVYEYGVWLQDVTQTYSVRTREFRSNPEWVMPSNANLDPVIVAAAGPSQIKRFPGGRRTGTNMAEWRAEYWYKKYLMMEPDAKGGTYDEWRWTWILEMQIDRLLLNDPLLAGQNIAVNYSMTCANDYLGLRGVLNHSTIPEPATMVLFSTGLLGWITQFARRRFVEFKRIFDLVVGGMGFVIAVPVMALTAIIIKIVSPGPVFFTQERVGKDGNIFLIYKLRTMRINAEENTGPMWAKENDPRLIKFGKIIRKLHLDELPQLLNVLRGEMSIVGPRPERPIFVTSLSRDIKEYTKRLVVKPGITGLAQVWHKYDETIEDVKKKIKYDLLYIRRMCLMVDIRILFQTIIASALGRGAR